VISSNSWLNKQVNSINVFKNNIFMKKTCIYLVCACFVLIVSSCAQKRESLLLAGSGWNKIVIVDKETKTVEWEYPLEKDWECNSVSVTSSGNILFSYRKGAKLIDRNKNEIWDWKAAENSEIQTARVLADGRILLGQCGTPAAVFLLNEDGSLISETKFGLPLERPHSQFRQININEKGNYMIPVMGLSEIWEVSPEGERLRSVAVKGNLFCMEQLPNKNWLVACGDSNRYVEVDLKTGKTVSEVNKNDIEGAVLFFVAQLFPVSGGGLYICNWQGHDKSAVESNSPQVIELDASGKIIWNLNDNHTFGMISAICPLN
jgi:outer membrane protein assembly factor BamB